MRTGGALDGAYARKGLGAEREAVLHHAETAGQVRAHRWMRWLHERGIPFVLRLKENMFIWKEGYVPVKLSAHAGHLEKRREHFLKGTWYRGRDPENGQRQLRLP